ncbi:MAG: hypothetical protein Q8S17_00070 [Humidesulfovibrio sp.]|nr:hypothetical protein [Humidesulfovibrio sp.]
MWLDKYADGAKKIVEELRSSLSDEEVQWLRHKCSEQGFKGMIGWYYDNIRYVMVFVSETPAQRNKAKGWQVPELRPLIVWASCVYASRAAALLEQLTAGPILFGRGASYRAMTVTAGDEFERLSLKTGSYWPFDAPDPFQE